MDNKQSEYSIYDMVKHSIEIAKEKGFKLDWHSTGWKIEINPGAVMAKGSTVIELHHYLNGLNDAEHIILYKKNHNIESKKPTINDGLKNKKNYYYKLNQRQK